MKIDVIGATKQFGTFRALRDVDLEIKSGELVALLGPSGSGKTTLLRIIAGLEWPDAGRVLFDGVDALKRKVGERHVGFVFQHYALFRHMNVFENVAFGLRVGPRKHRFSEDQIRKKVMELLDLVQLGWLADRYPNQLSGGQRQRIALARALAIEPSVLLLDEPFGALDAKVRKELRRWLRGLHDEIHVTSVFVTHDQEEALELADRIVVMDKGKIEQIGTAEDVHDRPATAFVHEFIGESVAIPVAVEGNAVRFGEKGTGLNPQGVRNGAAQLFVRPYKIAVVAQDRAAFTGTVRRAHGIGPARRFEIELAPDTSIEIAGPAEGGLETGQTVGLSPQEYRIFPRAA